MPGGRASKRWSGDVLAVAVLAALPALVFGVPAIFGHAVLPGDDFTQNFPLRVLAGRQLQSGHIPLYNPYIWSGAPLLAGWNAGAAYPLTFLFAILPGVAAWSLNMVITWSVAGLGMFFFLRALRLASFPSFLGALSFTFAGAMSAQVGHYGLVAGMSWVPLELLAVLRLTQERSLTSRLRWTAVLAGTIGLTILAGEPRAVDDAAIIVFLYAAWQVAHLRRRCGPAALSIAAAVVLGICLGAVQWMPGLAAVGTSQRGASSAALFNSGSLPAKWLLLMLVPDLLGGSGSFSQPAFFASYNLAEVTSYAGVLPLVAAAALLSRVRLRARPPEWAVWYLVAAAGAVLALGGATPLGHLLLHVPLFGDQRLQSRNILVVDTALAVLLAYWVERPFVEGGMFLRRDGRPRLDRETALALIPPLAMIAVVVTGLAWGAGLLHWLGAGAGTASADGRLKPWLVPYAVIGAAAIVFVIAGRRLTKRALARWTGVFVVADIVVFTLLNVVAAGHGFGGRPSRAAASLNRTAASAVLSGRAGDPAATRPVAALGYHGRFVVFDPGELDTTDLSVLGPPDSNAVTATPSVQGYSSIVDAIYASATGSHHALGQGQDVLSPSAAGNGVLDQLDTSVLLTVPAYLITAHPPGTVPGLPHTGEPGQRTVAAGHQAIWYFGAPLDVTNVALPDPAAGPDAQAGIMIGLVQRQGPVQWLRPRAVGTALLGITSARAFASVAMIVRAGTRASHLGPPAIHGPGGEVFEADGQLQDAVTAPRWGYAGHDGPFAIFADRFARGPLSLTALRGRSLAGATVRSLGGPAASPASASVSSRHGVELIRSVAAIPGWSATWHPAAGQPVTLAVRRAGIVQAVDVPPGHGVVTWNYVPPWFTPGLVLTLLSGLVILFIAVSRYPAAVTRRRGPSPVTTPES